MGEKSGMGKTFMHQFPACTHLQGERNPCHCHGRKKREGRGKPYLNEFCISFFPIYIQIYNIYFFLSEEREKWMEWIAEPFGKSAVGYWFLFPISNANKKAVGREPGELYGGNSGGGPFPENERNEMDGGKIWTNERKKVDMEWLGRRNKTINNCLAGFKSRKLLK